MGPEYNIKMKLKQSYTRLIGRPLQRSYGIKMKHKYEKRNFNLESSLNVDTRNISREIER
jgi:hypothetical protein